MAPAPKPHLAKTYSSIRCFLGLSSIICNLLLVWGLFMASRGDGSSQPAPTFNNLLWVIPFVFGILFLINLPFDWVAGYFLEKRAKRYNGTSVGWILQWLGGGLGYIALQTLGGYLFALWVFGFGFAPVIVLLLPAIVAAARIWQFKLIPAHLRRPVSWPEGYEQALKDELKKLKEPWPDDIFLYRSEDGSTLNGGRVGMGSHSKLMISDSSTVKLSPRELAVLILREERYLGWSSAQKHFHFGLGWGLLGVLVSVPCISVLSLSGLSSWLWLLASLTTWHGLGLMVLPGIARRQILKADRELVKGEIPKREYIALLKTLQSCNRTPIHILRINEILFYPIPSLQTRLNELDRL